MRTRLSVLTALLFVCAASLADADPGHAFRISGLSCKAASCHTAEGYQPGLTTVEVEGNLPDYAGYSVRLIVARRSGEHLAVVSTTTFGIFSDGHFTASIPAYNYPDGRYGFAIAPKQRDTLLAGGTFTKGTPRAVPVSTRTSSGAGLTGEWLGIAGTYGRVRIYANGTYLFNELSGRYQRSGNTIVFSGPLSVWNGGRATIGNGTIEFYWTTAEGAKQYFVFEKV